MSPLQTDKEWHSFASEMFGKTEKAKAILITAVPTATDAWTDTLLLPHLHRRRYILQTKRAALFRAEENTNE
jgi:hypothetical protein